jgi:hypothetical protein
MLAPRFAVLACAAIGALTSMVPCAGRAADRAPGIRGARHVADHGTSSAVAVARDRFDSRAAAAIADTFGTADLGPGSAVPWNPARPVSASEPWEAAVRLPGRIVSLPLSALGALTRRGLLEAEASHVVPRTMYALSVLPRSGVFITTASLGDRTGFGGGLRLRPPALGRIAFGEWSGSALGYGLTRAGLDGRWGSLTYEEEWRPQELFHGTGLQSEQGRLAHYAWKRQAVRLEARRRAALAGASQRGPRVSGAAWVGPEVRVLRRGRGIEDPASPGFDADDAGPIEALFPADAAALDRRHESLVWGARLEADARAGAPHWSRGARVSAAAARRDAPVEWLALRDARGLAPRLWRFVYEAEAGASFGRDPRTIRVAARLVDTEVLAGPQPIGPYDLARLGGSAGLDGFEPGRFADLDALTVRLAYLYPLIQHFEIELRAEAGGVWGDIQNQARLDRLKGSYAVMLRPRTKFAPLGELGVAWSAEGARVQFAIGGVE